MSVVQNNLYKYKNSTGSSTVSIAPPPGSVMAFLATSDPDGWIICDGIQRTDGSDGRYNNLIALNIGTGTANANNYTPPDYRGAFLRGVGTNSHSYNGINYTGPAALGNSQEHGIVQHQHYLTSIWNRLRFNTLGSTAGGASYNYVTADVGAVFGTQPTDNIVDPSGVVANDIRPYNYGVNWIAKL